MSPADSIALIADFTVDSLASILENRAPIRAIVAPPDGVEVALLDPDAALWSAKPRWALVWTRPERAVAAYARRAAFEAVPMSDVLVEVDRYAGFVAAAAPRVRGLFVPTWVRAPHARGLGVGDLDPRSGVAAALALMNARLIERLAGVPGVHLLDGARWIASHGRAAMSAKLWYSSKAPFSLGVFQSAASDLLAAIAAIEGRTRRLVIVDLDDTLWGNTVGEVGVAGLRLGGHDPIGEAFVDFQRALAALSRRGVLLAIASRNDAPVARGAIAEHPEMILRPEDFAASRIDWGDKAEHVASIAAELGLGLESVVFIDDDPVQRARVREVWPAVLVPEWPDDPMLARTALESLDCFDAPALTSEDRARAAIAATDRSRRVEALEAPNLDAWLAELGTTVTVEPFGPGNAPRVAQLFAKTNQMNLATRRLGERELDAWLAGGGRRLWAFRSRDRLGDAGLIGAAAIDVVDGAAELTDLLMSCRVFGRRVEHVILATAIEEAARAGARTLTARYRPTPRNAACLGFLEASGAARSGDIFTWKTSTAVELPRGITRAGADWR